MGGLSSACPVRSMPTLLAEPTIPGPVRAGELGLGGVARADPGWKVERRLASLVALNLRRYSSGVKKVVLGEWD